MIRRMRNNSLILALFLLGIVCHHTTAKDFSSNVLIPKIVQLRGGSILPVADEQKEVLSLIAGENSIIDTRMNWFLTFQGFLFAALSFSKDQQAANSTLQSLMIPAAVSCVSLIFAILQSDLRLLEMHTFLTQETLKRLCSVPKPGYFFGIAFRELFKPKYSMPFSILAAWTLVSMNLKSEKKASKLF